MTGLLRLFQLPPHAGQAGSPRCRCLGDSASPARTQHGREQRQHRAQVKESSECCKHVLFKGP